MSVTTPATRPFRGFAVEVARTRRLSPSFLRVTFAGPDLDRFATTGLDQRIKLVLPKGCGAALEVTDDWYDSWRAMPDDTRPDLRTYTVRAVRPEAREVDVDVVLHGLDPVTTRGCGLARVLGCACGQEAGPAVRWCAAARAGDPLLLIGPDAAWPGEPSGVEWRPPAGTRTVLVAGDETAVPAICSIVESLPGDARGVVVCEVPTAADILDLAAPEGVEVRWLARHDAPHGLRLAEELREVAPALVAGVASPGRFAAAPAGPETSGAASSRAASARPDAPRAAPRTAPDLAEIDVDRQILWEVPEVAAGGTYAWIAGEAALVRDLRRHLVADLGMDRRSVAFMGYWRRGRAEAA